MADTLDFCAPCSQGSLAVCAETDGILGNQLLPRRLLAKQACDLLRRALEDKDITRARQ